MFDHFLEAKLLSLNLPDKVTVSRQTWKIAILLAVLCLSAASTALARVEAQASITLRVWG